MSWDQEVAALFSDKSRESDPGDYELQTAKLRTPWLFRIWDISQKFLFLMGNMLLAKFQNANMPDHLISVLPNTALDPKKKPIFMGLSDKNHSFCCVKSGEGQPQLQIVERSILQLYQEKKELKPFTFYSKADGGPETCSFESAEFPNWFISTSSEPNRPIGLSPKESAENTLFFFERKDSYFMM
ncbi:interleukin-36 receptor antagonist protein [Anolis carolinensis]|uniref:Interleukin-1 n=1 Tax=Anolis carolinensis TaxID=28377 RepID=A0A803SUV9_ANOCA|nr:PREDICTED: interleukin-36 receptor antagonist protein [Anolis carolinensis]|eukprot:XP_003224250.1 PREDICTED: interleukin-36 receptor antagonist protein [Anolis carolinensis]